MVENFNNSVKLSVIVPVYKAEKYINECIDSLINQTFKEFEIVLVDDGSPDNCPVICDEYAAIDSRIKVIHKQNGGSVSARKAGLQCSTGRYVTFVDADDWLDLTYVEQCVGIIDNYQPDIVYADSWFLVTERQIKSIKIGNGYAGLFDRPQLEELVYPNILYSAPFYNFGIVSSLWTKIIRRELLEQYMPNMPENIRMGDDLVVSLPCMLKANTVYFSNICGYYYRQNPNSITHTFDTTAPMRIDSLLNYLRKTTEAYDKYNIKSQISIYAMHILQFTVTSLIKGSNNMRSDLKLMKPLWHNSSVKDGLKAKVPFKVKLLILAAKSRQVLLLKIIKKCWARKDKGVA